MDLYLSSTDKKDDQESLNRFSLPLLTQYKSMVK